MKYETLEPTLDFYKVMLKQMKEIEDPSATTEETIAQLEKYLQSKE